MYALANAKQRTVGRGGSTRQKCGEPLVTMYESFTVLYPAKKSSRGKILVRRRMGIQEARAGER